MADNRYNFTSPGAAFGEGIQKLLLQRKLEERQRMLDEITRKDRESMIADRELDRKVQQERYAEEQRRQRQELALRQAQLLEPGQEMSPEILAAIGPEFASVLGERREAQAEVPAREESFAGADDEGNPIMVPATVPGRPAVAPGVLYRGTPTQREEARQRQAREKYIAGLAVDDRRRQALEYEEATGRNAPAGMFDPRETDTRTTDQKEYEYAKSQGYEGNFLQWQREMANLKAAGSGGGGAPYFNIVPLYDAQGRPTGAMRVNGRTGKTEFVSPEEMGGLPKAPPGNLGQRSIENEASADALKNLETLFEGGAKNLVGPAEGRARRFGQATGLHVTEDFANFDAASRSFENAVIKAITGAQMSEPEAARIQGEIPRPTDHPTVWKAKAIQTYRNLQRIEQAVKARTEKDEIGRPVDKKASGAAGTSGGGTNSNPRQGDLRKKYNY